MWYSIIRYSRFHTRKSGSQRIERLLELHASRSFDQNDIALLQRARQEVTRLNGIAHELQAGTLDAGFEGAFENLRRLALHADNQLHAGAPRLAPAATVQ